MITLLLTLLITNAQAACAECAELASIVKQYKAQSSAEHPAYAKLEARAVSAVQKMTSKTKVLRADELDAYFEVLRYATPVDPGAVFVEDTIDVIKANRKAIDLKIKKLPSREASVLEDALAAYTANAESGPDQNR